MKNPIPENRKKYPIQRNKCVYVRKEAISQKFQNATNKGYLTNKEVS